MLLSKFFVDSRVLNIAKPLFPMRILWLKRYIQSCNTLYTWICFFSCLFTFSCKFFFANSSTETSIFSSSSTYANLNHLLSRKLLISSELVLHSNLAFGFLTNLQNWILRFCNPSIDFNKVNYKVLLAFEGFPKNFCFHVFECLICTTFSKTLSAGSPFSF